MTKRSSTPKAPWVLFGVLLVAMIFGLLLQGYTDHDLGASSTSSAEHGGALRVGGGGPVISRAAGGRLVAHGMLPGTVALTFDDGPDPTWTPRILDVLRREHVPATFFLVGSRVLDTPSLVAAELAQGDEIGNHTFTHTNLTLAPGWRQTLETSLTEIALAGTVARTTALLRPPYSSVPTALRREDLPSLEAATKAGYLVVLANRDAEDWRRPGVGTIVRNAVASGRAGVVVLLHDGGGNRAETVAALPRIIAAYRAKGFRFVTVSAGLGLAPDAAVQPVGGLRRVQGTAFAAAMRVSRLLSWLVAWMLVPLAVLSLVRAVVLAVLARRHARRARRRSVPRFDPSVAVIVPAYNEAVGIARTVGSLLDSDLANVEVIVVDDGSTDGTAEIVAGLGLDGLRLLRQQNAGKAAALNAGLAATDRPIVVMVDGDTVFERGTLRRLVAPLADSSVGAVSGNTKVGNRRHLIGLWQHLEYVSGFNLDRRFYDELRCMPTVPGAIGAFRRSALLGTGGVGLDTLAEDTDLTMAILRGGWRVVYEQQAVAWTEAPSSLSQLWRQRYRWCYGTLQATWKHRHAAVEPGEARWLGLVGLPYLVCFQVVFPLLAPVIDLYAIYGLLFLNPWRVAAYWLGFLAVQLAITAYALRLDGERLRSLWALPVQQFVYRQLMYLVVVQSVSSAVLGGRLRWHKLERTGEILVRGADREAPAGSQARGEPEGLRRDDRPPHVELDHLVSNERDGGGVSRRPVPVDEHGHRPAGAGDLGPREGLVPLGEELAERVRAGHR